MAILEICDDFVVLRVDIFIWSQLFSVKDLYRVIFIHLEYCGTIILRHEWKYVEIKVLDW